MCKSWGAAVQRGHVRVMHRCAVGYLVRSYAWVRMVNVVMCECVVIQFGHLLMCNVVMCMFVAVQCGHLRVCVVMYESFNYCNVVCSVLWFRV
jgi:hypothetical protein